uniref:Uncharacterized protein n=1 Tax=Poecilia reticulata TaxID=8081 RepID=A0A3P9Q8L1_POERE
MLRKSKETRQEDFAAKASCSSVHTIICKCGHDGNVQPSCRSGSRWVLCPTDERVLVQNVQLDPRTKSKDLVQMLEKCHTEKARLQFANNSGNKIFIFGAMSCSVNKLKQNCLVIMAAITCERA